MNDLLKEEEFVEEKRFNLWRHFFIYCIAALVHLALFTVSIRNMDLFPDNPYLFYAHRTWVISSTGFPLFLAFAMILMNKKTTYLPLKVIFSLLLGFGLTYLLGFLTLSFIDTVIDGRDSNSDDILIPFCLAGFYIFIFCLFILPVARYKQKRKV